MKNNSILVSEIFSSLQGESLYTGKNTIWVRLFNCNLQCDGFGQDNPTNPDTYELPYKSIDISAITKIEDVPLVNKGCDSSFSWSKKYKHLMSEYTASELCDNLEDLLSGTERKFYSFENGIDRHLCFTGGEPLLKKNQKAIIQILEELDTRNNIPANVTFETNGTQILTEEFLECIYKFQEEGVQFHSSISPKLFNVSGEKNDKAWKFDVIQQYWTTFDEFSLKFVIDNNDASWLELDNFLSESKKLSDGYVQLTDNIYIMPVGATKEQQEEDIISTICDRALNKGFNVSARVHTYIYGNAIGT